MLRSVRAKFLVTFIPTCVIAVGGLWVATRRSGLWCGVGWGILLTFGIVAFLQIVALVDGLARLTEVQHDVEQNLERLAQRDAELFAQGKSFDEVRAQYKRPK
jgi:hypothetical protein